MKALLVVAVLTLVACGGEYAPDLPGTMRVTYLNQSYPVRQVADEPTPDLTAADIIGLPDGGRAVPPGAAMVTTGPAIRVGDATSRQTATDVLATFCAGRGLAIAPGWRNVVVKFDDTTAEHIFYFDC